MSRLLATRKKRDLSILVLGESHFERKSLEKKLLTAPNLEIGNLQVLPLVQDWMQTGIDPAVIDLVILNFSHSGKEALPHLSCTLSYFTTQPVIVVTHMDSPELARQAVQMGAQDWVVRQRIGDDDLAHIINMAFERKNIENQLKRQILHLEEQKAVLAHDIKDSLNSMVGFSSLVKEQALAGEPITTQFLEKVERTGTRVLHFMDEVMKYSKVQGNHELIVPIPAQDLLNDVLENLAFKLKETHADITVAEWPVYFYGRRFQLMELLQNLIGNSIKYRHKDRPPEIRLSAQVQDSRQEIHVVDNGQGMTSEALTKIFDAFFQAGKNEG
ncbi:MAG: ATP-binding protein, partial [Pseudobdellovibrionaceae bacterium]